MNFVIGVEGGGTKSTFIAADLNGNIIDKVTTGTANINSSSLEIVKENILAAIDKLLEKNNLMKENCASFCIGAAGIDSEADKERMKKLIRSLGIKGEIIVVNDAEIALEAGIEKNEGIIVIAGTGSIAYGKDTNENHYRAGGWDYLVGDEGSGYWIAIQAINKALRKWDSEGVKSKLLSMLMDEIGTREVEEFICFVYKTPFNKKNIARLAAIVDKAFQEGDQEGKIILMQAADELVLLASSIVKRLRYESKEITLVAHGSILVKNQLIYNLFKERLYNYFPKLKVVQLNKEASLGAVKCALISIQLEKNIK